MPTYQLNLPSVQPYDASYNITPTPGTTVFYEIQYGYVSGTLKLDILNTETLHGITESWNISDSVGNIYGDFVAQEDNYTARIYTGPDWTNYGGGALVILTWEESDIIGPSITFNTNSRSWGTSNATVSFSASDPSNVTKVEYCFSTSTSTPSSGWITLYDNTTGTSTYNGSATVYNNGAWYLHIRATDKEGNVSNKRSTGTFNVDKTTPTFTANPESRAWSTSNASVTVGVSYGPSGLSQCQYAWSTSTATPSSGWTNLSSSGGTVSRAVEGASYLHLRATSVAGESTNKRFGTYNIDKTAPTLSASPGSQSSGSAVSVAVMSEALSGVNIKYAWTTSTTKPTSGWISLGEGGSAEQNSNGTWYLHLESTSTVGLSTYIYKGPYVVISSSGTSIRAEDITNLRESVNEYANFYNDTTGRKFTSTEVDPAAVRSTPLLGSHLSELNSAITRYSGRGGLPSSVFNVGSHAYGSHVDALKAEMQWARANTCWSCDLCDTQGCLICVSDSGCGSDGYMCSCDIHYYPPCQCNSALPCGCYSYSSCFCDRVSCTLCYQDLGGSCGCYIGGYTPCGCYGDTGCSWHGLSCVACVTSYNRLG
jgi:hypothetical protein